MMNLLDNLNPQQREAVKEIEKPLLIIAGAGLGKTLTVASKIAYLLEQSVKTESILALAFNEMAAKELKGRVVGMVGDAEGLCISTFHSFCNQVIKDNILSTKLNANFKVITDTAQLVYLTKNINSFGIEHLEFNHEPYTLAEEIASTTPKVDFSIVYEQFLSRSRRTQTSGDFRWGKYEKPFQPFQIE